jgi:malate synthase
MAEKKSQQIFKKKKHNTQEIQMKCHVFSMVETIELI